MWPFNRRRDRRRELEQQFPMQDSLTAPWPGAGADAPRAPQVGGPVPATGGPGAFGQVPEVGGPVSFVGATTPPVLASPSPAEAFAPPQPGAVPAAGEFTSPRPAPDSAANPAPAPTADQWVMPQYRGVDICDWLPIISELKRGGDLEGALEIAVGCMDAMREAAMRNPENVLEHYVKEVVIIQRKMKDYRGEVDTIKGWLSTGLPNRPEYQLDYEKRLAKAQAMLAKSEGRDPSAYHAQWHELVEYEKAHKPGKKGASAQSRTGRSRATDESPRKKRKGTSRLVPRADQFAGRDFVAVDFETANRYRASACAVALVRVADGQMVDRYSCLIRPPDHLMEFEFTDIHGITAADVNYALTWEQIAADIEAFIGAEPVYAHNASFDASVWRKLDEFYGLQTCPSEFYCSYRIAQRLVPGLENYKLPTVVQACAPGFRLDHHQAASDAAACAAIVASLQAMPWDALARELG
ncbi:MAG: exonuclease domain-containing protein [Actinomycetaceae bacterium]|nr:exonuclease domain-containing protein [Actinomycetaceae bacterium]MDU0971004.1 exonuclease domain-containing protein [Actinomycetaceae bacterium]